MGTFHVEVTLKNAEDAGHARRGNITDKEVRQITTHALVDTGADYLAISESMLKTLGVGIFQTKVATYANNVQEVCKYTEPVEVHWEDRAAMCSALVIPGTQEAIFGAFPMEEMDLIVHPHKKELLRAHGNIEMCRA